jgi:hypothetical protein
MPSRLLITLTILIFCSCSTNKYIFNANRFENLGQSTVANAVKRDIDNKSKDISLNHRVSIGESIYPNVRKFELSTPKTFTTTSGIFNLTTDYYYTPTDSLVKVILYQWENSKSGDNKLAFQKQFNQLRRLLTEELGEPRETDIERRQFNDGTFRDGIKWTGKVNAYLFMLGNDRTKFRLRLAIYGE